MAKGGDVTRKLTIERPDQIAAEVGASPDFPPSRDELYWVTLCRLA
jgi:hypothetical protein